MAGNFRKDLEFGQIYEKLLLNYVGEMKSHKFSVGNFKEYDVEIHRENGLVETYEVKADRYGYKTGNICIEYKCNGKNSGIITSTATYWAIFIVNNDKYELYIIPRKILLENIELKSYKRDAALNWGRTNCYLFDKTIYNDYKIVVD